MYRRLYGLNHFHFKYVAVPLLIFISPSGFLERIWKKTSNVKTSFTSHMSMFFCENIINKVSLNKSLLSINYPLLKLMSGFRNYENWYFINNLWDQSYFSFDEILILETTWFIISFKKPQTRKRSVWGTLLLKEVFFQIQKLPNWTKWLIVNIEEIPYFRIYVFMRSIRK